MMVGTQRTGRNRTDSVDIVAANGPTSAVSLEDVPMEDQGLLDFDAFTAGIQAAFDELDNKNPSTITADDVQAFCALLNYLKEISGSLSFKLIVQKRPTHIVHLVLRAYRYHTPSLPSSQLSDTTRETLMTVLKPCLHSVLRVALAQEEFAKECLEKSLSREDAFSMTLILCMATTGFTRLGGPGKTPWWLPIDSSGHLLLMKQYLSCIGLLSKEICTPVYMKIKDEKVDVYSYVLTSASMMVLTLLAKPMSACVFCLMDTLKSTTSSLVALFISDLLAFVSRIAATPFTLDLIKAVLHILGDVFRKRKRNNRQSTNILVVTCCRLMSEVSADEKILLLEQFPIRRHFFFWSHFPPSAFLDQPDIIGAMWNESLSILREVTAGCPKSAASATFMLCRLPLALQCLYNLEQLADIPEFKHPEIKEYRQKVLTSFIPVYRILVAVPGRERLSLVQTAVCLLLKLGSSIQPLLQDKDIAEVLEGIISCLDERTFLGASSFIVALGRRRPLRGTVPDPIQKFFTHYCSSSNPRIKNAAALALLDFSSWVGCDKLIAECGKSVDLNYTLSTFEKQDQSSFEGLSCPAAFDRLFDRHLL